VLHLDARVDLDEKPFAAIQVVKSYLTARPSRTAASHKSRRTASSSAKDGAISITF
jgi:hypothetical protein